MHINNRMTRRGLLAGSAAAMGVGGGALLLGSRPAHADVGTPKNLIIVNAVGGWDTTYTIDPKPGLSTIDAPSDGTVREIGGIPILDAASRPSVAAYFEDFASITTVVNGLQTSSISHTAGYRRIMTGTTAAKAGLIDEVGDENDARLWLQSTHEVSTDLPVIEWVIEDPIAWWREAGASMSTAIFGKSLLSERLRLDGILALWHPSLDE